MRSVQDGKEASAKERCQWSLGLSKDGGCTGRMRHGHHCRVYLVLPPDNCSVRGNETSLQGLYGGQTEARVDAASVVVGATNVLGHNQCNWIQCKRWSFGCTRPRGCVREEVRLVTTDYYDLSERWLP
jgi:hypothetical protein